MAWNSKIMPIKVLVQSALAREGESPLNRRQFLRGAVAAGVGVTFPSIVPAAVLGRGGAVAPSERICSA